MSDAWGCVVGSHQLRVFGGVGGAKALNCVPEEHFPCSPRHYSLRGGVVGIGGGAGEDFLEGVEVVVLLSPLPASYAHLTEGQSSRRATPTNRPGRGGVGA